MRGHACRSGEPMVADRMSSCVACLTSGGLPATRVESFDQQFVAGDIQRTGAVLDEELNVLVDKGSLSGCRRHVGDPVRSSTVRGGAIRWLLEDFQFKGSLSWLSC
jgi:hypothetical protein